MTADGPTRGMLDTATVILLGEITDPTALPDKSVISAITLAELSVGPHVARDDDDRAASNIYSRPRPTLKFFRSTPTAQEPSAGSPRRCARPVANRQHALTMP